MNVFARNAMGLVALAAALAAPASVAASEADVDWRSEIWFDVTFDTQGKVQSIEPFQKEAHPEGFWSEMTRRLSKAKVEPRQIDGKPATFRTGMAVSLNVTKGDGGGQVAIRSLRMHPLPVTRYAASYPRDASRVAGWSGQVTVTCTVQASGECGHTVVDAPAGMPESVRRWAKASIEGWRFQPQLVGGQPIETEVKVPFVLNTLDDRPVDFRDPRKL